MANRSNAVLAQLIEKIELPESAYEIAEKRYQDIGDWFLRQGSSCVKFDPLVFPQGSFRLGTAIRPASGEDFDLDMGCSLQHGLSKSSLTQEQLKRLVGDELELYRTARNIKEDLAEKRRCWRLEYADSMSFHMDIVPCIPVGEITKSDLRSRMFESKSFDYRVASEVAELAVSITDNEDAVYRNISEYWRISNPEGYARWFESRMKLATAYLAEREMKVEASIESLPYYKWRTPLQTAIQLLKRHRDTMFNGKDDFKPISIIITTLAARSYNGESDLIEALSNILDSMERYIQPSAPRVPNPVNSAEDFADKWYAPEYKHLNLESNFRQWLYQAKADFAAICSKDNSRLIVEAAKHGFAADLDKTAIEYSLGLSAAIAMPTKRIQAEDPRPWFNN